MGGSTREFLYGICTTHKLDGAGPCPAYAKASERVGPARNERGRVCLVEVEQEGRWIAQKWHHDYWLPGQFDDLKKDDVFRALWPQGYEGRDPWDRFEKRFVADPQEAQRFRADCDAIINSYNPLDPRLMVTRI